MRKKNIKNNENPLEENYTEIVKIFGRDFLDRSYRDLLSTKDVLEANDMLANHVYGKNLAAAIMAGKTDKINSVYHQLDDVYKKDISSSVDLSSIGIVLIRPEQFENREKYIEYLKDLKLNILYTQEKNLDMTQYFLLYKNDLINPYTRNDSPTRAFNYLGKKSYLVVVSGDSKEYHSPSISDYLHSIKGEAGRKKENTMIGDITINSMSQYLDERGNLKQSANILLDPIGAYRMIINGKCNPQETENLYRNCDIPILYYGGRAVHIPDGKEIERELGIICSHDEIQKALTDKILTKTKRQDENLER